MFRSCRRRPHKQEDEQNDDEDSSDMEYDNPLSGYVPIQQTPFWFPVMDRQERLSVGNKGSIGAPAIAGEKASASSIENSVSIGLAAAGGRVRTLMYFFGSSRYSKSVSSPQITPDFLLAALYE
jgi:hypothetical protein